MRLRSGIRRLNESQGGVNSATDGYHETITAAYVQLLAQYLASCPDDLPLGDRVAWFLASPLAAKRALSAFYSTERLMSTTARAGWVEPDLAPLSAATVLMARQSLLGQFPIECRARGVGCAYGKNFLIAVDPSSRSRRLFPPRRQSLRSRTPA